MKKAQITVRPECSTDFEQITKIIKTAFQSEDYSNQKEHILVEKLRKLDALEISLVAVVNEKLAGHVAFTKIKINDEEMSWYGLAPVAVHPDHQGKGVGSALIKEGLKDLKGLGAKGCVLLGDPGYYARFGFSANANLVLDGVPPEYFQIVAFEEPLPNGSVTYHPLFDDLG